MDRPEKLFSRGYFGCTTGQSTSEAVSQYLDHQGEHHGYASHLRPPVFVQRYAITPDDEVRLRVNHAVTLLRFHVVLATWMRRGVFGPAAAEAVADRWRQLAENGQVAIEKVSFVPDHVHLAIRVHPSVSPAGFVVDLMNSSQVLMWGDFSGSVIQAGVDRLWQPSAYIGSYGDLESNRISAYVRNWEESAEGL